MKTFLINLFEMVKRRVHLCVLYFHIIIIDFRIHFRTF
nr:MAG TPA: hypothetical protein [Caudoviricetes sp.]